jgi:hypothetical protein
VAHNQPRFAFLMSTDVGQCQQWYIWVGLGRKCRGSRWNRSAISFRSQVISTSGFVAAILSSHVNQCRTMSVVPY